MVNILYLEISGGMGGSGNALSNILRNLDRDKYFPVVAFSLYGPQIEKIRALGFPLYHIRGLFLHERQSFRSLRDKIRILAYPLYLLSIAIDLALICPQLFYIVKKHRVHILHLNNNVILNLPGIIISYLTHKPCVCHIRCTRNLTKIEKLSSKLVNNFIVLTQEVRNLYKKWIPENKLTKIYDGIDLREFVVTRNTTTIKNSFSLDSMPIVGIVGRIVEGKGHEEFILAAKQVLKKKPEVRFLIVGEGVKGEKLFSKRIDKLLAQKEVRNKISITGWKDNALETVSIFDIAVQPYTLPEGLPNAVIEAMALGKPVIASDIPGPSEIVDDGVTGFLVPPKNPQALAEKIIYLLDHPRIARRMGGEGRIKVKAKFDIKKEILQIEGIYEKTLAAA